jgi:glutaconate CoA-transferase subunit B
MNPTESTTAYSWAELMAVSMSRLVKDGDLGGVGASAHIPLAGLRLAQLTHAPNLGILCGGSGGLNPTNEWLTESSSDYRNLVTADFRYSLEDVVDMELAGRFDFAFVGGMQVDKFGNANMSVIGPWDSPKVRGPGTVGVIFLGTFRRSFLYTQHHTPKILVDKVDFVSGAGWMDGGTSREETYRNGTSGPEFVFTPLGVFDFEETSKHMRIKSLHPGVTVDQVQAATGFELLVPDDVPTTGEPTAVELDLLRSRIDRAGVLREFGSVPVR